MKPRASTVAPARQARPIPTFASVPWAFEVAQRYMTNSAVSLDHEGHALDVLALHSLLEEQQCPASLLPTKAGTGRTHPLG